MRTVKVIDQTRGTTLGENVEVADSSLTRFWGLLGRRGLDAGGGLWIKPSSGVHTIAMRFAIDVVGLDRDMKVIKLWPRLVPYRLTSVNMKIKSVIELSAGRIGECHIELGDVLQVIES